MKKDMPLEGLRWSCDSGSALYDTPKTAVLGRAGGVKICIKHLADNSFGIYIFHMLWVNILYKVVKFNPLEYGVWVIVPMMLLILVASDITTLVYKRIPYIGKFI